MFCLADLIVFAEQGGGMGGGMHGMDQEDLMRMFFAGMGGGGRGGGGGFHGGHGHGGGMHYDFGF